LAGHQIEHPVHLEIEKKKLIYYGTKLIEQIRKKTTNLSNKQTICNSLIPFATDLVSGTASPVAKLTRETKLEFNSPMVSISTFGTSDLYSSGKAVEHLRVLAF
jgi:hypothetical protein